MFQKLRSNYVAEKNAYRNLFTVSPHKSPERVAVHSNPVGGGVWLIGDVFVWLRQTDYVKLSIFLKSFPKTEAVQNLVS